MNTSPFYQFTSKLNIYNGAPLDADELRKFSASVTNDLSNMIYKLNEEILPILPNTVNNAVLDGKSMLIDENAAIENDHSLTWNSIEGRPKTIYESYMFLLMILANIDNGLKEGIAVGSSEGPITLSAGGTQTYSWPYTDNMFNSIIHVIDGTTVSVNPEVTVTLDTSSHVITITNTSALPLNIFGKIWHPVFIF